MSRSAHSAAVGHFITTAAAAYRATGIAAAISVARMLEDHAGGSYLKNPTQPPATRHLDAVLDAADLHTVAQALGPAIKDLGWTEGELPMPASFQGRYAYVTVVGAGTEAPDDRFYFGLYLQAPHTYYPSHWHRAEELYYVLSGTASWQRGSGALTPKPTGSLIHHAPDEPHVMETHGKPLLAMWAWIGDLRPGSYRIVDR
jgi:dimethylpropiothetin dethiomethylase